MNKIISKPIELDDIGLFDTGFNLRLALGVNSPFIQRTPSPHLRYLPVRKVYTPKMSYRRLEGGY